jgi:DNA-directed RNA polymerase subunit K/omega
MSDQKNTSDLDLEIHSKYELVVIASREARRLNERARAGGKELKRRVTDVAWDRLVNGDINYTYGELPYEDEPLPPPPTPTMEIPEDELTGIFEGGPQPAKKAPAAKVMAKVMEEIMEQDVVPPAKLTSEKEPDKDMENDTETPTAPIEGGA